MTFWALISLLNGIVAILFGVFVYVKNKRNPANVLWLVFTLVVAFWSFSYFFWQISTTKYLALFWCRTLTMGSIFIPVTFLHFLLVWLDLYQVRKKLLFVCYLISCLGLILNFTPLFVKEVTPILFFKYWPKAGAGYLPFLVFWTWEVVYACYIMYKKMKLSSPIRRNQIKYVLIAVIIGFGGGFTNFPLWYDIKILPYGNLLVSVYVGLMAYAIARYQLMEIDVFIKKTLVFASLFVIALGAVAGVTLTIQELVAGKRFLGLAISTAIIILAVRPLENFLIRITDKVLFQKKYDYKQLIKQFMDELKTMVLNAHDIAQSTLDILSSSIRPASSAIFIYNRFTNKYDLIASVGVTEKNFKIADTSSLVNELKNTRAILNVGHNRTLADNEKKELVILGIEIVIPLIVHKDMIGILYLGKKKSDEQYVDDDIDVLSDLSGALSIAINNAQLFDERADAEKRAMIGTLAMGINHEIDNPLNIIKIKLQSFRILAQRGLLAKKTKDEIITEVNTMGEHCLESVERIADITQKVAQFAKPDKNLIVNGVDVNTAIDDTMAVLRHELELERIQFEKHIISKSPYVVADRGQLNQILFNLIKNALQASNKENAKITISVDTQGPDEISIKVTDNGPGIPSENIDKLFLPFYTTKEPGKGTGLGLALVKNMVERNNGTITVHSQEGKGSTFTVVLKSCIHNVL